MIEIPLYSRKYLNLVALIDDEDNELINQYRWNPLWNGYTYYAHGRIPGKDSYKRPFIRMHRLIMNTQPGEQTDHINHNGLDNRRSNLRICTRGQNLANMQSRTGVSKFKGVSWSKQRRKWITHISLNKKLIYLGCSINEINAAHVYDKKARELFGEYALTNF